MTLLYLSRHGETAYNVPGEERLRGLGDMPLNAHGRQQAFGVASTLKRLKVKHVATDDTLRARLTADYIARAIGVEPIHDQGLRPWDIGDFEGRLEVEAYPKLLWYIQNVNDIVPGGEPYRAFFDAWRDAFWYYVQRAKETAEPWALVLHSGHFATLDDVRLGRGSTPSRDYEPTTGTMLVVNTLDLRVGVV